MKIRGARSFEKAVQDIIDAIGDELAAQSVNRSTSLVRKWSDPDAPSLPTIEQALALDRAYVEITKQPAVIHAVYTNALEKTFKELYSEQETIVKAMFSLQVAVAEVTRSVAENIDDIETGRIDMSNNLRKTILTKIVAMEKEVQDLERAVNSH